MQENVLQFINGLKCKRNLEKNNLFHFIIKMSTIYNLKSMNYLSYKIFEFYNSKGIEILDIGISTECGIPNYGLCEFKENIGCDASSRFTLIVE